MKNKKAIHMISASAIAATAFVSTVTTEAEAATVSQAEKLVQTAKDAGTTLKWAISIQGTADGKTRPWAAYNNAKAAYNNAVKAVNTLPAAQKNKYMAELDMGVKVHIDRTMRYIDAITAGEKINEKKQALAYQLDLNIINDQTEKAYHELSTEIRKQAILLDRVYGQSTRDLIRSQYKQAAEKVRDDAMYPVTVKIELDLATKAMSANNSTTAEKHITEAKKYLKYVDNTVMKRELTDRLSSIETKYTPKVERVSAVEPKRIKVEFNKAMLSGYGINGAENSSNYSVSGRTIKNVKLSDDKKSALIELNEPLYTNSAYTVTVKRNIQTTENEPLSTSDYVTSFTFYDNLKPTVTFVTTNSNGDLEIKFSELIANNSPLTFTIDGKIVSYTSSNDTDTIVIKKSELNRIGLQKGKSYSIVISGARDQVVSYPNTMDTYNGIFFYNTTFDTSMPEVKNILVKNENTFTIEFSESLTDFSASHLAITKGSTTISPSSVKDISGDKTKFEVKLPANVYGQNEAIALLNVQVKAYKDLANNIGQTIDRPVTLTRELNPPQFVSANYDVVTKEIHITFNKPLKAGTPIINNMTVYDSDNNPIKITTKSNVGNKMIIDAKNLKDGVYIINASAGVVKDDTTSQNDSQPFRISVAIKADTTNPEVTLMQGAVNGQIKAVFSEPVTLESATSPANYLINGATLPSNTNFSISSDQKLVTITLPEGKIETTTGYLLSVRAIKDLSGNEVTLYNTNIELVDNKKPVLNLATRESNSIKLTFSENIMIPSNGLISLDISVGGLPLDATQYTVGGQPNGNELIIIPQNGTSFITGTISISTTNSTISDSKGNIIKADTKFIN